MSPNPILASSSTMKVAFGETLGVPSALTVATKPSRCSRTMRFMSAVSIAASPWQDARRQWVPGRSCHVELDLLDDLLAAVLGPGELELARPRHLHVEGKVWVGRDARMHLRLEHLRPRKRGREGVDDVARDGLALGVLALAGLHDVGDQGFDLDHVADLGAVGKLDARLGH